MSTKKLLIISGALLLSVSFVLLGFLISHDPLLPFTFSRIGTFNEALWNARRADVLIQVVLIFTSALGILTFFEVKK